MLYPKKAWVWRQYVCFFCRRMNFDLAGMIKTGLEKQANETKLEWGKIYTVVFPPGKVVLRQCSILISQVIPPGKTLTFQYSFFDQTCE